MSHSKYWCLSREQAGVGYGRDRRGEAAAYPCTPAPELAWPAVICICRLLFTSGIWRPWKEGGGKAAAAGKHWWPQLVLQRSSCRLSWDVSRVFWVRVPPRPRGGCAVPMGARAEPGPGAVSRTRWPAGDRRVPKAVPALGHCPALPLGRQPCSQPAVLPGGFRVSTLYSPNLLSLTIALAELLPAGSCRRTWSSESLVLTSPPELNQLY